MGQLCDHLHSELCKRARKRSNDDEEARAAEDLLLSSRMKLIMGPREKKGHDFGQDKAGMTLGQVGTRLCELRTRSALRGWTQPTVPSPPINGLLHCVLCCVIVLPIPTLNG